MTTGESRIAEPAKSRAVLIGAHKFDQAEHLPELPAISASLPALRRCLTDPAVWGLPPENCVYLLQPSTPGEVLDAIHAAAGQAEEALLVYYAGHGLPGSEPNELLLSVKTTRKDEHGTVREHTAIFYPWLAREIRQARSACKVVILDCCYSGLALNATMGQSDLAGKTLINGAFVMTSSAGNVQSLAAGRDGYTAFTGELLHVLEHGVPGAPAELTMLRVFQEVHQALSADRMAPAPMQANKALGSEITLFRNRAYEDADPLQTDIVPAPRRPAARRRAAPDPFEGWRVADPTEGWAWREDAFRWGPFRTPLILVEGDGSNVITEASVRIIVDHQEVKLPEEILEWKREIEREQEELRRRGDKHYWNGNRYAIEKVTISRKADTEAPIIFLRLQQTDYYTFLAAQQLDRPFADGTTPRSRYLDDKDPLSVPAFMSCSLGTNIAVITADKYLIFSKRSESVGPHPGFWNSSANEALSRDIDSAGRNAPNLYNVARRGLREELALEDEEYRLDMLGLSVDRQNQWGALFVARLNSLTGEEFLARRSRGVADKFEHAGHHLEPCETFDVVRFMFARERRDLWAPTAPALFHLALVSEFGRTPVELESREAFLSLRREEE